MDSKAIRIGNVDYAYYELANPGKPKMLLLHGMMVESHCFEKLAAVLQPHYHLFFLDLKGHGKSGNGRSYDEDYTNDVIDRDLLAFFDNVIKEPFFLVGYSLGGQYSLKFSGTHPNLVRAVVLIDSAPAISFRGALAILFALFTTPRVFKDKAHFCRHYDRRLPGLGDYMLRHCAEERGGGKYALRYDKRNFAPNTAAKNAARIKDLWDSAKRITAPTLVLRAEQSPVISDKLENMMKTSIRNLEVVHLPDMEHNLVFSHPELVANHIHGFCQKR